MFQIIDSSFRHTGSTEPFDFSDIVVTLLISTLSEISRSRLKWETPSQAIIFITRYSLMFVRESKVSVV